MARFQCAVADSGRNRQRSIVTCERLRMPLQRGERCAAVIQRIGIIGIYREGLVKTVQRFLIAI